MEADVPHFCRNAYRLILAKTNGQIMLALSLDGAGDLCVGIGLWAGLCLNADLVVANARAGGGFNVLKALQAGVEEVSVQLTQLGVAVLFQVFQCR